MRRSLCNLVFYLICILFSLSLWGQKRVDIAQAEKVAENIASSFTSGKARGSKPKLNLVHISTKSGTNKFKTLTTNDEVYYYVFNVNTNDGFVVVSGNDIAIPVLGYSNEGGYNEKDMPPALAWWMNQYKQEIQYALDHKIPQDKETKAKWADFTAGTSQSTYPKIKNRSSYTPGTNLIETKWDQGFLYNEFIKSKLGTYYPTGCGATVMAQVMNYWKHPEKILAPIPSYTTYSLKLNVPGVAAGTPIDWDNMADTYIYHPDKPNYTPIQVKAVSELMFYVGVSLEMDYKEGGSGSYTPDSEEALMNYFGYNAKLIYKINDSANWDDILKAQIDALQPIIYRGSDSKANGGHVFVCDGYQYQNGTLYFHFNWGWGGRGDNYCTTSALIPSVYDHNFSDYQAIIIDIKPGATTCAAPTGLNTTIITANSARLNWNTVSGAQSYTVEYKTSASSAWNPVATTAANTFTLPGLTANTVYNWRVKSNCSTGNSSGFVEGSFITLPVQTACIGNYEPNETLATAYPINVNTNYSAGIGRVGDQDYYKFTLSGASNIVVTLQNLPKDYELKLLNSAGTEIGTSVNGGTTNESITKDNLTSGTYYVHVYGYNGNFDLNQCYNLKVTATTAIVCAVPTGLNTTIITANSARLNWNTVSGAQSYTVEYKTSASSAWNPVATTAANTFTLPGLTANTVYNWRVKSNCSTGNSSGFVEGSFITLPVQTACIGNYEPNETLATAYPINVNTNYSAGIGRVGDQDYYKFTLSGASNIVVTLQNLPKDYELKLLNSAGTEIGTSVNGGTTNESITKDNLTSGTYYVHVYGYGYNGNFDLNQCYNLKVTATTAIVCAVPTGLNTTIITANSARLNWNTVSGAQSYTVEYKTSASSAWNPVATTAANTFTLPGLTANTVYNWRVKSNCSTGNSSGFVEGSFITLPVQTACIGNYEPNEILATAYPINVNTNYSAGIGRVGDQDYYKFTLSGASNIVVTLQNLPKDYELKLLNSIGTEIGTSVNGGTTNESITKDNLTSGTYYVHVYGYGYNGNFDLNQCYNLKVTATTAIVCAAPTGLNTTIITANSARLNWNTVSGAQSYTVEYKTSASSAWNPVATTAANTFTLPGLTANTVYNWRVKSNCSTGNSSGFVEGSFITLPVQTACIGNYEPNETLATAYPINVNTNYSAGIGRVGDQDYYKFTLSGASNIVVTLQNLPKDYELKLLNSAGTEIGTSVNGGTTNESITKDNLTSGTYYVHVYGYGYNGNFDLNQCYNLKVTATTAIVCAVPTGLNTTIITANSARLNWNTVSGAQSYTVEYKTSASSAWNPVATTAANTFTLPGLTANTVYNWRVKSNCSTGNSSGFVEGSFITLPVQTACIGNYEPNETLATAYPINVNTNYSAGIGRVGDQDYYKFTLSGASNIVVTLQNLPKDYELKLLNSAGTEIGTSVNGGTTNESITKDNLTSGTYYVHVYGYGYNGNFDLNQCYNLKVTATTAIVCAVPTGLNTTIITANSARLNWNTVSGAQSYTVEYKTSASSAWNPVATTAANTFTLPGLTANTVYNWRVKSNCSTGNSSGFVEGSFITLPVQTACIGNYEPNETLATAYPINVNTNYSAGIGRVGDQDYYKFTLSGASNIVVTLQNLPKDYELKLLNSIGTEIGISVNGGTTNESITKNNLTSGTYYVRVYGYSSAFDLNQCYNLKVTATTAIQKSSPSINENLVNDKNNALSSNVTLYPNPVDDMINIKGLVSDQEYTQLTIIDRNGGIVKISQVKVEDIIRVDVSDLSPNIYHLTILGKNFRFIKK